jgi:hypothetical protein
MPATDGEPILSEEMNISCIRKSIGCEVTKRGKREIGMIEIYQMRLERFGEANKKTEEKVSQERDESCFHCEEMLIERMRRLRTVRKRRLSCLAL